MSELRAGFRDSGPRSARRERPKLGAAQQRLLLAHAKSHAFHILFHKEIKPSEALARLGLMELVPAWEGRNKARLTRAGRDLAAHLAIDPEGLGSQGRLRAAAHAWLIRGRQCEARAPGGETIGEQCERLASHDGWHGIDPRRAGDFLDRAGASWR